MTYQPGLTLITCTGGRPEAFEHCAQFVARQTYTGPLQWIVVDDGAELPAMAALDLASTFEHHGFSEFSFIPIFPRPLWQPGQNTLPRNLIAAIEHVHYDKILFIEDDDWYAPVYAARMAEGLEHFPFVGEYTSRYYHLPSRRYRVMDNGARASLCQTGIRAEALPLLQQACSEWPEFIDARLWQLAGRNWSMFGEPRCVGIKGLPGRPGIGIGHRPDEQADRWTADPDLRVLESWIGSDVALYSQFTGSAAAVESVAQ